MDPIWRGLLIGLWVFHAGRELQLMRLGQRRIRVLLFAEDGQVTGCRFDGGRDTLQLLGGSVVRGRYAWLRIRLPDRLAYGELLLQAHYSDKDWQRFQLIWRQSGARFGRSAGP